MTEPRTRADVIRDLRALLASASNVFFPDDSESEEHGLSAEEEETVYQMALDDIKREERWYIREALRVILDESPGITAITDFSERASMAMTIATAARILMDLDGLAAKT